MSRVGKYPVGIPDGVTVSIADNVVTAKGKVKVTVKDRQDLVLEIRAKAKAAVVKALLQIQE